MPIKRLDRTRDAYKDDPKVNPKKETKDGPSKSKG